MGKDRKKESLWAVCLRGSMIALVLYAFTYSIHGLDLNLGLAIIPWLVYLPFINGADEQTAARMNWQMVFFIASCMSIGTVASSLGLGTVIADTCKVLLQGSSSPYAILFIIFAIVFVLNFIMTPLAIYSLISAPILMLVTQLGLEPAAFAYAISACSEAIILPYEYVPYLIVYAFGMISMKDFIKWNIFRSIVFFGGIFVVLVPYWYLIGVL
jgi:di/tricarboxylate transporter